jgi:hypothetical protein
MTVCKAKMKMTRDHLNIAYGNALLNRFLVPANPLPCTGQLYADTSSVIIRLIFAELSRVEQTFEPFQQASQ